MEEISLRSSEARTFRAVFARPDAKAHAAPWPGVVVLHELFGLTDDIRSFATRFADLGYLAVAPDLYSGEDSKARCIARVMRSMATGQGDSFADIDAARRWLASDPRCNGKVGVIGFCQGGGFALVCAGRFEFGASAVNYGVLPRDRDLDRVLEGACPIVASFGAKDWMVPHGARKLRAALDRLGIESDVKEYPDAGHSFLNHHTGVAQALVRTTVRGFHGPSADDAWKRIASFFEAHLR